MQPQQVLLESSHASTWQSKEREETPALQGHSAPLPTMGAATDPKAELSPCVPEPLPHLHLLVWCPGSAPARVSPVNTLTGMAASHVRPLLLLNYQIPISFQVHLC